MADLIEYGFFDYLAPQFGGLEMFQGDDYLRLLDDMSAAGMNSLNIAVRAQTTGWRCWPPPRRWVQRARSMGPKALSGVN